MNGKTVSLTAALAMSTVIAMACECGEVPQRQSFKNAVAVFRGRVVQVNHLRFVTAPGSVRVEPELHPPDVDDHTLVTIKVDIYWKGAVTRVMKIYSTARPSMCDGYRFEEGKEYIVYTSPMDPKWAAIDKLAPGTTIYEVADCPLRVIREVINQEMRLLGRGRSPVKD